MKFDFDKDGPRIIRGAIIGTGLLGLAVIARSVRMFTTFHHARQIPNEFFRKQMSIRGIITFVTDKGLLRVDHKPIARIPFSKYFSKPDVEAGRLTVGLAGVDLTSSATEWLKKHVLLKPVWISLIKKHDEDTVLADVYVKRGRFLKYSLNREIVRMGFGRVPGLEEKDHVTAYKVNAAYSRLVHDLLLCEKYADKRGVGMWKSSGTSFFKDSIEKTYSIWFYAADTFRSGLLPRFFHGLTIFLSQLSRFVINALKITTVKSLKAAEAVKDYAISSKKL